MGMNTYRSKNDHSEHESWESRIGEELRASVSARAESFGATPHNYPLSDVMERVRVRARRRQARRAGVAVAACVATIAAVVGYRMLDDEPSRVTVVADAEQGLNPAAAPAVPAAPAEPAAEPVDPDVAPAAANPAPADAPPDDISAMLAEISSGPSLDWSPVSTGLWDVEKVQSLGDGRVLLHGSVNIAELPQVDTRPVTLVTSDGETWTEVSFPQEVSHNHVAVDGDHWVVAGYDLTTATDGDRVFASKDSGDTWAEINIEAFASASSPLEMIRHTTIDSLLVSGDDIVIALGELVDFDVVKLAEERGVVPEGETAIGWYYSPVEDDESIALILAGSETAVETSSPNGDAVVGAEKTLTVSYSQLGLTPEEQVNLERGSFYMTRLLHSDGDSAELTRIVGAASVGTATDNGFAVYLAAAYRAGTATQGSVLTSPDGRSWSETPHDTGSLYQIGLTPDAVWNPINDPNGTTLTRAAHGSAAQEVVTFDGITIMDIDVGPAGLSVGAVTNSELFASNADRLSRYAENPPLTATVTRDGYELRYNDPPGLITIVDQSTQRQVAEIALGSSGSFEAADSIAGIRETPDGGITITDPETGDELVTFTAADLEAINAQVEDNLAEIAAAIAAASGNDDEGDQLYSAQNVIGWSADGTDWAWQTQRDAFGVGDEDAWSQLAVGQDYVVAAVRQLPSVDSENSSIEGPRVFVAHTGG